MESNKSIGFAVFALIIVVGITIIIGDLFYNTVNDQKNFKQDQTTINALSRFSVKNNPKVDADYARLAAYTPKSDEGDDLKTEKVNQKLNEIRTFGKK